MLTFDRHKEFILKRYDDGRFGLGDGEMVRPTFRVECNVDLHLLEFPLFNDQQAVELEDENLEITTTVTDNNMLDWWRCGFGNAAFHMPKLSFDANKN